jgi:AraC-like DNA-binding protein
LPERPEFNTVSTNSAYSNVMSQKISQRMERVSKYIQDHYQGTITLSEIADVASMTEQSFSRWFRQTSGLTFVDYLMQLRTTVASNLVDQHQQSHDGSRPQKRVQLQFFLQPSLPENQRVFATGIPEKTKHLNTKKAPCGRLFCWCYASPSGT